MTVILTLTLISIGSGLMPSDGLRPSSKALFSPAIQLIGTWKGKTGCAGNFCFRSDGSYSLTEFGPAHSDSAGTWRLRREASVAVLVLTCTSSDHAKEVGKCTELTVVGLDDRRLAVKCEGQDVHDYTRSR
jgi:hypothetical protein